VMRSRVQGGGTFGELLREVRRTTLEAYSHQEAPFEKVVEAVLKERDLSRSPLFQVLFSLQEEKEGPVGRVDLGGLQVTAEEPVQGISKFDLTLMVTSDPEGIRMRLEYCADLFERETMERMLGHYVQLLGSVVSCPEERVDGLRLLTVAEERELVEVFNRTEAAYDRDKTVVELFEEQVARTPWSVAVVDEGGEVTYRELEERSNRLGHYLRERGVGVGVLVPLCVERGIGLITAILAVWKAGGAYVPIDPEYPAERIRYMLGDLNSPVLLSNAQKSAELAAMLRDGSLPGGSELINIEECVALEPGYSWEKIEGAGGERTVAYVMYTSGTSGKPKGVVVEQGNIVSLVKGVNYVTLDEGTVVLSTGVPSFDATTFEYWGPLLNGGRLILCPQTVLLDTVRLKELIVSEEVTTMFFSTGWFNQLIETDISLFAGLKALLFGGERVSMSHVCRLREQYPQLRISHVYGPTETTTFSTSYRMGEVREDRDLPIGGPLDNRTAYILNERRQLCPVGVPGELWIGGAGVSRGYLNDVERTAEKYIDNPYGEGRVYRTGDRCRWLEDGNIEFMGRVDEQVKVRGFRIEPGEIETVLECCTGVSRAVVVVKEGLEGQKRLVAYVSVSGGYERQAVWQWLRSRLPEYMVPSQLVELEDLPLTANGKVDRRRLPDPGLSESSRGYEAPRTETERVLAGIWSGLLGRERIGINDNFFEIGGDSIISIQVVSRARRQGYELQPRDLFLYQTIGKLSAVLSSRG
ncbi:MAG: amino acid adenylation domain-containing protein, partial [Variovorax sp.]|nr:amino acid adenylation domain-containing protein [Variovorax sp.]